MVRGSKKRKGRSSINWRKIIGRIIIVAIILFSLSVIAAGIYAASLIEEVKDFDPKDLLDYSQTSFVYDKDGNLITGVYGIENRVYVDLKDIPKHVRDAFVTVEDIRFYSHSGFDIKRIFGALFQNIRAGEIVAGGGTITQQVIRNTLLTKEQTIKRKVQEIYLAYKLEQNYSKDQILEMYLNIIYFAHGAYGIEAASRTYFNKSTGDLTVAEAALLVGIVKNPHRNSPFIDKERSLKRKDININVLVKNGVLTEEEGEHAKRQEIIFADKKEKTLPHGYFLDMALTEAAEILNISENKLYTEGYKIYTTLDSNIQNKAEEIYANDELFPKSPKSGKICESALVVLDTSSGEIRSLIGGRNYPEGQRKVFNRATDRVQPGSTIKPLVAYGPAMEYYGYTPVTFIDDSPVDFNGYKPTNYNNKYTGSVHLRQALARSINIPAVNVLNDIGIRNGIKFAEMLGIHFEESDRNSLAVALGGMEDGISPLELARAYSVFGDEGIYKDYTTIKRIEDPYGVVVYEYRPRKKQVISEETAFIMNDVLKSVTRQGGTASALGSLNIPISAKTGTVQLDETPAFSGIVGEKYKWTVAYNPEYTIAVWMGFDTPWEGEDRETPMHYLPYGSAGGKTPTDIIKLLLSHIYKEKEAPDFIKPPGVLEVKLDAKALWNEKRVLVASPLTPAEFVQIEYFTKDTMPTEESDYWRTPVTPDDFSISLNDNSHPVLSFTPTDNFTIYYIYKITDGRESLVHQITGTSPLTLVSWTDRQVERGQHIGYYIVPVHPELKENDEALRGTPTETIYVDIPERNNNKPNNGWDNWDWDKWNPFDWFN